MFSHSKNILPLVDCRIGSLEKKILQDVENSKVDCRIGSLEMLCHSPNILTLVDCRIGSLERKR